MDVIAFILALEAMEKIDEEAGTVLAEYISDHPEIIPEDATATTAETKEYLGID